MKKSKKYLSSDHLVVGPLKHKMKKDFSGKVLGWVRVLRPLGLNFRGHTVYQCTGIFGESFTACCRAINSKWFPYKAWTEESKEKVRALGLVYHNMLARCLRPDTLTSKNYYHKGVQVCEEWLGENGRINFITWAAKSGYELGKSIDRIGKDYFPETCRWVDKIENYRFTKRTKLSKDIVLKIREAYKDHKGTKRDFYKKEAPLYHVSWETIRGVIDNLRWKGIEHG